MDERRRLINRASVPQSPTSSSPRDWKSRFGKGSILLSVAFERCVFYSLTGNLVLFFISQPFSWESYNALQASFFFTGISYLTSFAGGFLGDAALGRYKTLLLSYIVYCLGYWFLPVLSFNEYEYMQSCNDSMSHDHIIHTNRSRFSVMCWPKNVTVSGQEPTSFQEPCSMTIYIMLFVIAIATGVYRGNMAPFGGDQAQLSRGDGHTTFFNWYYWCINIGTLFALSVITWVQQTHSFFIGYTAAIVCLGVSFLIFISGSCTYIYRPRTRTVVRNVCSVVREAFCRWRNNQSRQRCCGQSMDESSLIETPDTGDTHARNIPTCCLDYAKFQYGGSFNDSWVEDVKKLGKILCVFLTLVPYWMVYFQMQTTFLLQGLHMKLNITSLAQINKSLCDSDTNFLTESTKHQETSTNTQIVAAWFSLFDVFFVIILIPIVDRFLYPYLARRGRPITMVQRISVGMFFSCLAVILAGIVEYRRLKVVYYCDHGSFHSCTKNFTIPQIIGQVQYNAADMSVLWQIPQYALIGISEVFTCVAGIDFAYQMAPRSMKGIIMGLFYLFTGVGSFLGIGTMYAFKNTWFFGDDYGDINCRSCKDGRVTKQCHLDYYFFFLGGLQLAGLTIFLIVAKKLQLTQDLQNMASPPIQSPPGSIPGVVDNLPSCSSASSVSDSPRSSSSYGRKSAIRASIQRQPDTSNTS